jgi:hypothetical protein
MTSTKQVQEAVDAGGRGEAAMTTTHELKTWPESFDALVRGDKKHEIRRDDRGFSTGDVLLLREWHPHAVADLGEEGAYTGRELRMRITYKSSGGTWGLPDDLCVMSVEVVT